MNFVQIDHLIINIERICYISYDDEDDEFRLRVVFGDETGEDFGTSRLLTPDQSQRFLAYLESRDVELYRIP
jgi:hypothetical protein